MRARTYLIEALFIFVCLLMVATVVMLAFSRSLEASLQAKHEQQAIVLAQNAAEQFAANPTRVPIHITEDGYDVICEIEAIGRNAGTVYDARIIVRYEDEDVFALDTSRYLSAAEAEVAS